METMRVPVFKGEGQLAYEQRPVPHPSQPGDVLIKSKPAHLRHRPEYPEHTPGPPSYAQHRHRSRGGWRRGGGGARGSRPPGRGSGGHRSPPHLRPMSLLPPWAGQSMHRLPDHRHHPRRRPCPYLCAPRRALYKVNAQVARDDAVFFEPLSCAVGAAARAPIQAGDNVAIIGAGPMGLLFAQLYRILGAGRIIVADIAPYRLHFAEKIGVDEALNPTQVDLAKAVRDITGLGADLVVDAVGNQIDTAVKLARRGGQVVLFGYARTTTRPSTSTPSPATT